MDGTKVVLLEAKNNREEQTNICENSSFEAIVPSSHVFGKKLFRPYHPLCRLIQGGETTKCGLGLEIFLHPTPP
jgi:hypothetical protein